MSLEALVTKAAYLISTTSIVQGLRSISMSRAFPLKMEFLKNEQALRWALIKKI